MNSKRRAELQRKLTLNAVPTPPAGLAERIKADIPQYLEAESAPARIARSMNVHMRIAASVLLVVTSVAVAMLFVSPQKEAPSIAEGPRPVGAFAPQPRTLQMTDTTSASGARMEEVNLDVVEQAPAMQEFARMTPPPAAIERPIVRTDEDDSVVRGVEGNEETGVAGGVVGGFAEVAPPPPAQAVADAAAPVHVPADREYAASAPAVAPPSEPIAVTAEAPMLETRRERASAGARAGAAGFDTAMRKNATEVKKDTDVFGISVNAEAFHDIRTALENGHRPAASAVDVEALVNYFAGAPDKRPRHGVRLEVEASPAPIAAEGEHAVLRFTVDTAMVPRTSVATDARIEVVINDDVVEHASRVGDNAPLGGESILVPGTSVTGLYTLEMKPGLRAAQLVATVRLRYFENGNPRSLTEAVHGRDLAKSWQRASRRHRLASLGAVWGESLKGSATGSDVAQRAEELATQDPDDVRARELARAANASAAGGR